MPPECRTSSDENEEAAAALQEPLLSSSPTTVEEEPLYDGLPLETSLLIKSLYFLDALGSSTWGRFSAIYYNLHGLNPQHIGLIECLRSALPTVSQTLWGVVADRTHSRKQVWLLTKTASSVMLLTLAMPMVYQSFVYILLVSVGAQLFVSDGLLDAYTLDLLGMANKMYFGRYRLYASLSWGLGSIVMGWVTDHFGNFEPNFILFGLLATLMIMLVAWKIPDTVPDVVTTSSSNDDDEVFANNDNDETLVSQTEQQQGQNEEENGSGNIMELVRLAIRPRVLLFLLEVIIMGAAMATVERLLFLYLVNDLQASTLLCGLSVGVNVVFELPIFWYAKNIVKVLGHDGMFLVAQFCFFVRVVGYTWLTPSTKWFILPLEVLHGFTFALFWVTTVDISKVLVHQTTGAFWRTAIPSSVQMLYSAFGVSLGSFLGGWVMHLYGSRVMYEWTAAIIFVTWVVHLVGSILSRILGNGASLLPDYSHNHDGVEGGSENVQLFISSENIEEDDAEPLA